MTAEINNTTADNSGVENASGSTQNKVIATSTAGTYLSEENTPRDVRLLHLLLASQGVTQYEDIVPLQLMDFAYRYTRGVLKDAVLYNEYSEANMAQPPAPTYATQNGVGNASGAQNGGAGAGSQNSAGGSASGNAGNAGGSGTQGQGPSLTVDDIRLAIAARTQYQFKPTAPPKELLLQLAQERNKKALPKVPNTWGTRLPPEKYCLTNTEVDLNSTSSQQKQ